MTDQDGKQLYDTTPAPLDEEPTQEERREFLRSLGKWSQAVIGGVVVGGALTTSEPAEAWYNGGGGMDVPPGERDSYYRGSGWGNRGGSWYNRGGGWGNK